MTDRFFVSTRANTWFGLTYRILPIAGVTRDLSATITVVSRDLIVVTMDLVVTSRVLVVVSKDLIVVGRDLAGFATKAMSALAGNSWTIIGIHLLSASSREVLLTVRLHRLLLATGAHPMATHLIKS
jgi:hypothetical protein